MLKSSKPVTISNGRTVRYHQDLHFDSKGNIYCHCASCTAEIEYNFSPQTKVIIGYFRKTWYRKAFDTATMSEIEIEHSESAPIVKTARVCRACLQASGQAEIIERIPIRDERLGKGDLRLLERPIDRPGLIVRFGTKTIDRVPRQIEPFVASQALIKP